MAAGVIADRYVDHEFQFDLFDLTNKTLSSLQLGIPATGVLIVDLKSANENDTSKMKDFLHD